MYRAEPEIRYRGRTVEAAIISGVQEEKHQHGEA